MKTILVLAIAATTTVHLVRLWLNRRRTRRCRTILDRLRSEEAWYSRDGKDQDLTAAALWLG